MRTGTCFALLVVALMGACADDTDDSADVSIPPRVSVDQVDRNAADLVVVEGALLAEPKATARLCSALAESYPPQCGGKSVAVPDLDVTRLADTVTNTDAPRNERVVWTDAPIALTGYVEGDTLRLVADPLDEAAAAILIIAVAGPTCPVETIPPDPACKARYVADAAIDLWAGESWARERQGDSGALISTRTDSIGVAVFFVAAGEYQLVPGAVTGIVGTADPQPVTVGSGTEVVNLAYDTGIR